MEHITVLLNEAIEYLNIKDDGIYVDCTLGGAGHSSLILSKLKTGHLYCFDQDDFAINIAKERLDKIGKNYTIIKSNFVNIKEELENLGVSKIDGVLYDLGVSSFQFDDGARGFSYNYDAKLDMRMDTSKDFSAKNIINEYDYNDLVRIFYMYGEEPFSKQIAKKIVENRPINTTFELVEVIKKALPQKVLNSKGHPAKRIFQALRIEVNDELKVFEKSLNNAISMLNIDGRVVVISFHSLEDRICKTIFKDKSEIKVPKNIPLIIKEIPELELITKHPITPSEAELESNNRAHSAKMRVARKLK